MLNEFELVKNCAFLVALGAELSALSIERRRKPGWYGLIGGQMEDDSIQIGLSREIREELGIEIPSYGLIPIYKREDSYTLCYTPFAYRYSHFKTGDVSPEDGKSKVLWVEDVSEMCDKTLFEYPRTSLDCVMAYDRMYADRKVKTTTIRLGNSHYLMQWVDVEPHVVGAALTYFRDEVDLLGLSHSDEDAYSYLMLFIQTYLDPHNGTVISRDMSFWNDILAEHPILCLSITLDESALPF